MGITCGVDWAEDHHDIVVMDDLGKVLQGRRIDAGVDGYAELLSLIAEHGGSAAETPIALETDKNLLVLALRASGFTIYPINPREPSRATVNATIRLARSPITATPQCWPTSSAPIGINIARSPL